MPIRRTSISSAGETASSAAKLHRIATELWPLVQGRRVIIDLSASPYFRKEACIGVCFNMIEQPDQLDAYVSTLPKSHALRKVLERKPVIEAVIAVSVGDGRTKRTWKDVLNTMLHEFAHVARDQLSRDDFYPTVLGMKSLNDYLENRRQALWRTETSESGEEMMRIAELPGANFFLDNAMGDIDTYVFPSEDVDAPYQGPPLLGKWAVRTFQHDDGHDLLFYLLLYALERKADDAGFDKLRVKVQPSTFVPDGIQFKGEIEAKINARTQAILGQTTDSPSMAPDVRTAGDGFTMRPDGEDPSVRRAKTQRQRRSPPTAR